MNLATRNDGVGDGAPWLDTRSGDAICPVTCGACEPIVRVDPNWGLEFEPEIRPRTIGDGGTVFPRDPAFGIEQEARPS
jgi:hypothetical protein